MTLHIATPPETARQMCTDAAARLGAIGGAGCHAVVTLLITGGSTSKESLRTVRADTRELVSGYSRRPCAG